MKAIKFMAMLLTAAVMTFGAVSCGDDDDDDFSPEEFYKEFMNPTTGEPNFSKATGVYTVTANSLNFKWSFDKYYSYEEVIKFSNDVLIEWKEIETYPSAEIAKEEYEILVKGNLADGVTLKGNVITYDEMYDLDEEDREYYTYEQMKEDTDLEVSEMEKLGMKITRKD